MEEKQIDLGDQFPKPLEWVSPETFDLVVNISGYDLPEGLLVNERRWKVDDPIGRNEKTYRRVRDQIEALVLALLHEIRAVQGTEPGTGD